MKTQTVLLIGVCLSVLMVLGTYQKTEKISSELAMGEATVSSKTPSWKKKDRLYTGRVTKVHDGDSFIMAKKGVRLEGIDAPESRQMCQKDGRSWAAGRIAGQVLSKKILNKELSCYIVKTDQYNRLIGHCFIGDENINQAMVSEGWAYAYRYYSKEYVPDEEAAKDAERGLWQGVCEDPYAWRRAHRR